VNPYADATTLNAMGIALRLLQDPSLRTERASEAAVKEAARLAKEGAVGAETGSLADRQAVQNALVARGYQVPTTGTFDEATIAAIIDFKRKNNLAAGFTNDRGEAVFTPYIDRREAEALRNQPAAAR
jgi:pyruvate/2-oxoglutarate dehydrogenase complex dihydrolipoamide acyltransferase (E2) component